MWADEINCENRKHRNEKITKCLLKVWFQRQTSIFDSTYNKHIKVDDKFIDEVSSGEDLGILNFQTSREKRRWNKINKFSFFKLSFPSCALTQRQFWRLTMNTTSVCVTISHWWHAHWCFSLMLNRAKNTLVFSRAIAKECQWHFSWT